MFRPRASSAVPPNDLYIVPGPWPCLGSYPSVSQKMLIQQLRELEHDGIVSRTVYPQVSPKVEYALTEWGKAMCPALDSLLEWAPLRPKHS